MLNSRKKTQPDRFTEPLQNMHSSHSVPRAKVLNEGLNLKLLADSLSGEIQSLSQHQRNVNAYENRAPDDWKREKFRVQHKIPKYLELAVEEECFR